ncbi:MAG: hypothetical protein ACQES4_06185 [Bacillota bacterium]
MKVYGADFSGARDASRGIYYAEGSLENGSIIINRVVHCDDRLDLFAAIHLSKAPWGLDFPFSLPGKAFDLLQLGGWKELLAKAVQCGRNEFARFLSEYGVPSCEVRCSEHSLCCRAVDASINSFSALKRTNPNMRAMTYAGLKLLSYLRSLGNTVYPFDQFNISVSRLYEVYPSNTWHLAGLPRGIDLGPFAREFSNRYGFRVDMDRLATDLKCLDAADAVVACVTLGYVINKDGLEGNWEKRHKWINDVEWQQRSIEGLIVKVK